MFGDEASFWLDGTLHRTWARIGHQPQVDTFGQRKTAHVFGALSLALKPRFRRKIFLIIDNGPCHNLEEKGKVWLAANSHRIELFRLPAYSPNLNPIEGGWKETKKRTTHNHFFHTTQERDEALIETFATFREHPSLLARSRRSISLIQAPCEPG